MSEQGLYIQRIEIESLWNGKRHVDWTLRPDVNILSGVNGVGKSTILNRVVRHLLSISRLERHLEGVKITFFPHEARSMDFDVIRSFDRPVLSDETLDQVTDAHLQTELDFQLYQLQRKYLDYQVNLSNRIVELFTNMDPDAQTKAKKIAGN